MVYKALIHPFLRVLAAFKDRVTQVIAHPQTGEHRSDAHHEHLGLAQIEVLEDK